MTLWCSVSVFRRSKQKIKNNKKSLWVNWSYLECSTGSLYVYGPTVQNEKMLGRFGKIFDMNPSPRLECCQKIISRLTFCLDCKRILALLCRTSEHLRYMFVNCTIVQHLCGQTQTSSCVAETAWSAAARDITLIQFHPMPFHMEHLQRYRP